MDIKNIMKGTIYHDQTVFRISAEDLYRTAQTN